MIDATNPLDFSAGGPALAVGHTDSGGEIVQRAIPDARVVKAFNTVNTGLMVDPGLPDGPHPMFIAGDDEAAKATVAEILADFGWDAFDVGGIEQSRQLESLVILWVAIGSDAAPATTPSRSSRRSGGGARQRPAAYARATGDLAAAGAVDLDGVRRRRCRSRAAVPVVVDRRR